MTGGNAPGRNQAVAMRVNALVQIAQAMSADRSDPDRPFGDLRITLGKLHQGAYQTALAFANGDADLPYAVARGDVDLATINPSAYLTMAYRGTGPYRDGLPLRVIAVMPTWDRMLFVVSPKTGLSSLADIRQQKYPLKLSIRRSQAHGTRFVIDELFAVHGYSLRDIERWGGALSYVDTPNDPARLDAIKAGAFDAVFDEGVKGWGYVALDAGMAFLDLDEAERARMAELGWPMGGVRQAFPSIENEITAVSFGGWPIFTRASLPDEVAYQMARALETAGDRMVYDADGSVDLVELCRGTDAAPRDVPLHPGAERYFRERGYL